MKLSNLTKEEILNCQKHWGSDVKIARKLSVTRQYIFKLRRKYGINSLRTGIDRRNQNIYDDRQRGMSFLELQSKYNLSYVHICRIIKEFK